MKQLTLIQIVTGSLWLGACIVAAAQDSAGSPGQSQASAAPGKAETKPAAVRFEGTDLHLGSLPPVTFHGFLSQGYILTTDYDYLGGHTKDDGSFEFNEFGLNASVSPFPHTRVAAQGFMFDLGNVGNYSPMLDYGLVDYNFCDQLGVRGGRIRRPSGIYNQVVDIDVARTYVLLPQGVYDPRWRDFYASLDGGSFYGNFNLGKAGSFSYETYAGLDNLASDGGIARQAQDLVPAAPVGSYGSVEGSMMYGCQLWYNTPIEGLRAGVALVESEGLTMRYSVNPPYGPGPMQKVIDTFLTQYSLEYTFKSWTFQAEYMRKNNRFHDETHGRQVDSYVENPSAWYVGASYRFNKWLEVGSYYSEAYEESSNPANEYQRDLALAFRFDIKPWWLLKLEAHYLQGTALVTGKTLNPIHTEDPWFMLAAKMTFTF